VGDEIEEIAGADERIVAAEADGEVFEHGSALGRAVGGPEGAGTEDEGIAEGGEAEVADGVIDEDGAGGGAVGFPELVVGADGEIDGAAEESEPG
jgi:hypothetical protein